MTDPITPSDVDAAVVALDTKTDAVDRGKRTFLQFAAVETAVTVIPVVMDYLDDDVLDWRALVKAAARALLGGALAVVMRYRLPPA